MRKKEQKPYNSGNPIISHRHTHTLTFDLAESLVSESVGRRDGQVIQRHETKTLSDKTMS